MSEKGVSDALAPFEYWLDFRCGGVKRGNDSGGALLLLARGSPSPRQEFVAAIVRPEIDEADENIGQIGLGLDAVQFTGLYQRSQDRPIFGAVIMTREESILAGKGLRPSSRKRVRPSQCLRP